MTIMIPQIISFYKQNEMTQQQTHIYEVLNTIYKKATNKTISSEIYKEKSDVIKVLNDVINEYLNKKTQILKFINAEKIELRKIKSGFAFDEHEYTFKIIKDGNVVDDTIISEAKPYSFTSLDVRANTFKHFFYITLEELANSDITYFTQKIENKKNER